MILYELFGSEAHPLYQELHISNGDRYYSFLQSIVDIAVKADRRFLSHTVIKALNYHAISCLHTNAGEYRPCMVNVGGRVCPEPHRVQALMDDFTDFINVSWNNTDPVLLGAYILWRLNYIHPFINGNGRTARAACMFAICVKSGAWLPGSPILPELLRVRDRVEYVTALQHAHDTFHAGTVDLKPLFDLLTKLLNEQLASTSGALPGVPATSMPPASP